ncbi:MAG TPA: Wadjet anti-phage system protein JetD domain-containing protein [Pseudolabrys sp.]|nr:Wadjet anti-phage system protein JetD domain-containing protein [Pseudolabrys sp.]
MSGDADPAVALLTRLLSLSERTPNRTRPASLSPDYEKLGTASARSRFQDQIAGAERSGAVSVRNGKRERRHLIERITVKDPVALARHLGRVSSSASASAARQKLDAGIQGAVPWVKAILDDIESRWSRGEAALRLQPDEIEPALEFLTFLVAISKDQARGLDSRSFSQKVTGDTKAFDRHSTRIAAVMAEHFGESALEPRLVWEKIGLERFRHPINLRGPVVIEDLSGTLVDGRAKPFASIHPEMLPLLKLRAQPALLLTIENYASFYRYVREVEDGALVIYTGGFASGGVVEILKSLLGKVDANVPFFHWGDIDPGGLRIFRFLEENLSRKPRPYMMDRATAEAHGRPAKIDPTLGTIAKTDSALADVAAWLAQGDTVKHLEQEALDPVSPLRSVSKAALRPLQPKFAD